MFDTRYLFSTYIFVKFNFRATLDQGQTQRRLKKETLQFHPIFYPTHAFGISISAPLAQIPCFTIWQICRAPVVTKLSQATASFSLQLYNICSLIH